MQPKLKSIHLTQIKILSVYLDENFYYYYTFILNIKESNDKTNTVRCFSGKFGKVYLVREKSTGTEFAAKVIRLKQVRLQNHHHLLPIYYPHAFVYSFSKLIGRKSNARYRYLHN